MEYKDKKWLQQKYLKEKLGIYQIAPLCKCHPRTIHQWLIKFNIPRRKSGVEHWSEEQKELRRQWNKQHPEIIRMKGKHHSIKTRLQMSFNRKRDKNANWKGNNATAKSASARAQRWFKDKQPCVICRNKNSERHHIDKNTFNNDPQNIIWLCDLHHMQIHKKNKPWKNKK